MPDFLGPVESRHGLTYVEPLCNAAWRVILWPPQLHQLCCGLALQAGSETLQIAAAGVCLQAAMTATISWSARNQADDQTRVL